jgi:hypothetical protein
VQAFAALMSGLHPINKREKTLNGKRAPKTPTGV